jgi:hypothetical protein
VTAALMQKANGRPIELVLRNEGECFMIMGLVMYLIGCAADGSRMAYQPLEKRNIHGVIAGILPLFFVLCVVVFSERSNAATFLVEAVVASVMGVLGYLTVVYRPKWIVGSKY